MDKKVFGFGNLLAIIEALPDKRPDDTPLRDLMPGVWPTLGDLRELVASQQAVTPDIKQPCDHDWIGLYGHPAAYECSKCKALCR